MAPSLPWIVVVGFPKTGTTTVHRALGSAGLISAHWRVDGQPVGKLIYDGWFRHGDPLALFDGVDAVTQMDFCQPERGLNLWPNLDIALLLALRRLHPQCRLILNTRPAADTAASFDRWGDLAKRTTGADIPGLPGGYGATAQDRIRWIETHHAALRQIFAADPNFLDFDITAADAPERLGTFIGRQIRWWGVENAQP